jgi:hypothetical protein
MAAAVFENRGGQKNAAASEGHTDTVVKLWFLEQESRSRAAVQHLGLLEQPDRTMTGRSCRCSYCRKARMWRRSDVAPP